MYAWYNEGLELVLAAAFLVIAFIIFWNKNNDLMGVFASLVLVLCGLGARPLVQVIDPQTQAQYTPPASGCT